MRRYNKGLRASGDSDNHNKTPGLNFSHNSKTPRGLSEFFSLTLDHGDKHGSHWDVHASITVVTIMKVCL